MKESTTKPNKIKQIGFFWIILGTFIIFTRIMDIIENSRFDPSLDFAISSTISLLFIIVGISFIFIRSWAVKAMFILSIISISYVSFIGTKFLIKGISQMLEYSTPGSSLGFVIGLMFLSLSTPFFFIIKYIKSDEIKEIFARPNNTIKNV